MPYIFAEEIQTIYFRDIAHKWLIEIYETSLLWLNQQSYFQT